MVERKRERELMEKVRAWLNEYGWLRIPADMSDELDELLGGEK